MAYRKRSYTTYKKPRGFGYKPSSAKLYKEMNTQPKQKKKAEPSPMFKLLRVKLSSRAEAMQVAVHGVDAVVEKVKECLRSKTEIYKQFCDIPKEAGYAVFIVLVDPETGRNKKPVLQVIGMRRDGAFLWVRGKDLQEKS